MEKPGKYSDDIFAAKVQEMLDMDNRVKSGSGIARYSVRSVDSSGNCIGDNELPIEILPPIASPLQDMKDKMKEEEDMMQTMVMYPGKQEKESHCEDCLDNMPIAMSYTPLQRWKQTYEPAVGFDRGTIFPELDLPFIGEGVSK